MSQIESKTAERVLVEAGAGCGKTTSIITKFLGALKSKKDGGKAYLPEECLLLTFTDAAAREMRVRIKEKDPTLRLDATYVGTFHAYCLNLLSSARLIDSQAKILSDEELILIIKDEFIEKLSTQKKLEELLSFVNLKELLNLVLWGADSDKEIDSNFADLKTTWQTFVKGLERSLNSLDLEELDASDWPQQALNLIEKDLNANIKLSQKKLLKEIVKKDPELYLKVKQLRNLQKKEVYTPLLDLFEKEKEIFNFLAEELKELRTQVSKHLTFTEIERRCLTGLRDGTIKAPRLSLIIVDEFQDTSPEQWEIIERISSETSDWYLVGDPKQSIYAFRKADIRLYKKLKSQIQLTELSTNYRSSEAVLRATNHLQENFFTESLDPAPQSLHAGKEYPEVAHPIVVSEFDDWDNLFVKDRILERDLGSPNKKHAVLFREWKKLYSFAEYLLNLKIPFQIQGSENHLDHYLSHAFVESLCESAQLQETDYLAYFYSFCESKEPSRWPQGRQWVAAMERLLVDLRSKDISDWRKIASLLASGAAPNLHIQNPIAEHAKINITLLTIHGSKGLEYDFIYLPDPRERISFKDGFEEDEIPFKYSVSPQLKSRSLLHELQKIDRTFKLESEQKRLFYVAITRAKLGIDFFIPLPTQTRSSASDDAHWWSIWREESEIKRFKWSHAIRTLDRSMAEFREIKHEGSLAEEKLIFKAQPLSSKEKAPAKVPFVQKQTPHQIWGETLHSILENWNGEDEHLEGFLSDIDEKLRTEMRDILLALQKCAELREYWTALKPGGSEWMVLREEAIIEQKENEESFRYADVLMLKKDEALIIDWKTSLREELLNDEDRRQKIKAQLAVYTRALERKIPNVKALAIGILRDTRTVKAIKLD